QQDGKYYIDPTGTALTNFSSWTNYNFSLSSSQLVRLIPGNGNVGSSISASEHPNLNLTGGTIRVGYYALVQPATPGGQAQWGIDNFNASLGGAYSGTARVTVTAHDGPTYAGDYHGRTSEQSFDVSVIAPVTPQGSQLQVNASASIESSPAAASDGS